MSERIRIQVPLTPDEHAALERLATAQRRSLGAQAAVMLAPLLVLPKPKHEQFRDWKPSHSRASWRRVDFNDRVRAIADLVPGGWTWSVHSALGTPKHESEAMCPDAETAMREADAALGEGA